MVKIGKKAFHSIAKQNRTIQTKIANINRKLNETKQITQTILQSIENEKTLVPRFENDRDSKQKTHKNFCLICGLNHSPKTLCRSKPSDPPSKFYPRCDICEGHHPEKRCYFEILRTILNIPSFCERCNDTHIGFCSTVLYRQHDFSSSFTGRHNIKTDPGA